jgi:HD superfamily phosphodiesterase
MTPMPTPPLPRAIAGLLVPRDDISAATWAWAHRTLPAYLLDHSVRSFCWGAAIAAMERWQFEPRILWTAALMHDVGLTRIARNAECFEVEGATIARRFLRRHGLPAVDADRAGNAIILHMRPSVSLEDGVEAVLLDRATSLDVGGEGYDLVEPMRDRVVQDYPRGAFDRLFVRAMAREAALRPTCQSARLVGRPGKGATATSGGLAERMARSPWAPADSGRPAVNGAV